MGPTWPPRWGQNREKNRSQKRSNFGLPLNSIFSNFGRFWDQKWSQDGTKIGLKINVNLKKPICCHPYEKPMQKHEFSCSGGSKNHKKNDQKTTKKIIQHRSAFGTHFYPIWADFGGQVGTQNRQKIDPRRHQKCNKNKNGT